jgi:urease subunit alpha
MTCEPLLMRPQFGAFGTAPQSLSANFVCGASIGQGLEERLGLRKPLLAARGTRRIGKADMLRNDACPRITVNPQTFEVSVDGQVIGCPPATTVPLNRLYMMR